MKFVVLYMDGRIFGEAIKVNDKEFKIYENYYRNKKLKLKTISEAKAKRINKYIEYGDLSGGTDGLDEFYPAGLDPKSERRIDAIPWNCGEDDSEIIDNILEEDYNLRAG